MYPAVLVYSFSKTLSPRVALCAVCTEQTRKYPPEERSRGVGAFPAICEPHSENEKEHKKVQADSKDAVRLNLFVQQQ